MWDTGRAPVNAFKSENDLYQNSPRIPQRSGARVSLRVPGEPAVELSGYHQPLAKRNSAPAEASARRSLSMLREQLKPPNGGVFLGLNGIVIKSHGGSDMRVSQTPSISVKKWSSKSCTPTSGRQ